MIFNRTISTPDYNNCNGRIVPKPRKEHAGKVCNYNHMFIISISRTKLGRSEGKDSYSCIEPSNDRMTLLHQLKKYKNFSLDTTPDFLKSVVWYRMKSCYIFLTDAVTSFYHSRYWSTIFSIISRLKEFLQSP